MNEPTCKTDGRAKDQQAKANDLAKYSDDSSDSSAGVAIITGTNQAKLPDVIHLQLPSLTQSSSLTIPPETEQDCQDFFLAQKLQEQFDDETINDDDDHVCTPSKCTTSSSSRKRTFLSPSTYSSKKQRFYLHLHLHLISIQNLHSNRF